MKILNLVIFLLFMAGSFVFADDENPKYDSHGRRDPFVPLVGPGVRYISSGFEGLEETPKAGSEGLVLNGIVWDPQGECLAVIDGEICREKGEVGTCQITAIREDRVILLDKEGKEVTLTLFREEEGNVQDKE